MDIRLLKNRVRGLTCLRLLKRASAFAELMGERGLL
jgi:hypothetical protein